MAKDIQEHLLQLFEQVRLDLDTSPTALLDGWQEGSAEWRLLNSFRGMVEQVQERIHQLKQAEEQMREKEEQYRNIFEASFDGINISTLDGPIVEANPALCRMFGYTRDELLSISPALLIHSDSLHVMSEVLQEVGEGRESLKRATCLRKDGTSFLIESHVTPFTYKGQPHLLSVTRDITERVEAERQLREREEQYRSIFEAVTDSLSIARLEDGQIVEVNPAQCKMFGYTPHFAVSRRDFVDFFVGRSEQS